jgi:hypothetical protein
VDGNPFLFRGGFALDKMDDSDYDKNVQNIHFLN